MTAIIDQRAANIKEIVELVMAAYDTKTEAERRAMHKSWVYVYAKEQTLRVQNDWLKDLRARAK